MRLLLIADPTPADALASSLKAIGIVTDCVDTVEHADFLLATRDYEAVLLDARHMPAACPGRWRREGIRSHLLILLPKNSTSADRARCLDAGADACLVHPLRTEELAAHLRALHRRDGMQGPSIRRIHDLEINPAIRSVRRAGRPIHLTPREFDLLNLLATNAGKVLTRSMIREHLYDDQENAYSNVVDVYIRYLRRKIDRWHDNPLILTRWGEGYLLRAEGT